MTPFDIAHTLLAARRENRAVPWRSVVPASVADAYAVQDATLAEIGPIGGWKVGSKGSGTEPTCAPLPDSGVLASGATLQGPPWLTRGIEVEVALRVGRDIDPQGRLMAPAELAACFDAVLPAIEVVERRLSDPVGADALAGLADLLSHGALVVGEPAAMSPASIDLRRQRAALSFDGRQAADATGGNPVQDGLWPMLAWLALHCCRRGQPLRAGQIVTTGSCTGLLPAPAGSAVRGEVENIGAVELRFA